LLLDEPLASLDRTRRRGLQLELKRIQGELGTTFLYVTHDQTAALRMADRIGVMEAGRLVEVGPPEQLYARPRTAFTAEFLSDGTVLSTDAVDVIDAMSVRIAGVAVPSHDTAADGSDVVAFHIPPGAVRLGEGSLRGTVTARAYGGSTTELTLTLDAGPQVITRQQDPGVSEGAEVTLSITAVRPLIGTEAPL
jgi:ABC-type Fe3+/spermidine/putrescine transport system ATPase subunit